MQTQTTKGASRPVEPEDPQWHEVPRKQNRIAATLAAMWAILVAAFRHERRQLATDSAANSAQTGALVSGVVSVVIIGTILADPTITADLSPLVVLVIGFVPLAVTAGLVTKAFKGSRG